MVSSELPSQDCRWSCPASCFLSIRQSVLSIGIRFRDGLAGLLSVSERRFPTSHSAVCSDRTPQTEMLPV